MIIEDNQTTDKETAAALDGRTIVLDCRWLGLGGAGRVTELLLKEFQQCPPPGNWTLWGLPDRIHPLGFTGAQLFVTDEDPRRLFGQGCLNRVPPADAVLYMH